MRWLLILTLVFASACRTMKKDVISGEWKGDKGYVAKKDILDPENTVNIYDRRGRRVGHWKRSVLDSNEWRYQKERK